MTTQQIIQYYGNLLVLQYLSDTGVQVITTVSDVAGSLQSTYFILADNTNGPYLIWYNVSGGGTPPSISGFTNIEVDITTGASATAVASATVAAINTIDSNMAAEAVLNQIILSNNTNDAFAVAGDYNTGFLFSKNNAVNTVELNASGPIMNQLPIQVENAYNLNPTVQTMTFSTTPVTGFITLGYGTGSFTIPYSATLSEIQTIVDDFFGIGYVTVTETGFIYTFTFNIITVPALLYIISNTLGITVTLGTNQAVGVQLDVIGKYAGVTRSGIGQSGPITLTDSEFIQFIQLAIITNTQGSSLATIVGLLYTYFPGQIQVFDLANTSPMNMTYYINSAITSEDLLQLFIAEGLLPHPMGVGISIIVSPYINDFFGCCDYATATPTDPNTHNSSPLNCDVSYTLGDYDENYPMLDYAYAYSE